jgi:hypothetical protein
MAATNKQLLISESRGDSNRCTPCRGKLDQHDTYASRIGPRTPRVHFLRSVPVYSNLSQVINNIVRTLPLLRKWAPDTTPSPTEWSAGPPPSFSPNTVIEAIMKAKHLSTLGYYAYRVHITGMWSVRSILAHGYQPLGPYPTQTGATTQKTQNSHITLPAIPFWVFHWSP